MTRRGRSGGDASDGTVLIYSKRFLGLSADDDGITFRQGLRVERVGWEQISRFRDGGTGSSWVLEIVLRTGRTMEVPVPRRRTGGELAGVVWQVALSHDIAADLTGFPPRPRPSVFYQDPWGQAGVRYWDGTHWSPLLPREIAKRPKPVENRAAWPALPVAAGQWTYAAEKAKERAILSAVCAAAAAVLVAVGLAVDLVWDRGAHPRHWTAVGWFTCAALAALFAAIPWWQRRRFRKLDHAARESAGRGQSSAEPADAT